MGTERARSSLRIPAKRKSGRYEKNVNRDKHRETPNKYRGNPNSHHGNERGQNQAASSAERRLTSRNEDIEYGAQGVRKVGSKSLSAGPVQMLSISRSLLGLWLD
jgi:hypothetical protein